MRKKAEGLMDKIVYAARKRKEYKLISLAEQHPDDKIANKTMKVLWEEFDETYMWCEDCDGVVTKE